MNRLNDSKPACENQLQVDQVETTSEIVIPEGWGSA